MLYQPNIPDDMTFFATHIVIFNHFGRWWGVSVFVEAFTLVTLV